MDGKNHNFASILNRDDGIGAKLIKHVELI